MAQPNTTDLDTELSAVNSILGAIGQAPVTTLGDIVEITGETSYTGDGSKKDYEIGISFNSSQEIKASKNGINTTLFTIAGSTLTFDTAPANNDSIRIYREKRIASTLANPEVSLIYNLLKECNMDVQSEGWTFNKEDHVKYAPDSNKNVKLPKNILQLSLHDGLGDKSQRLIIRDGKVYDKVDHTDEFTEDLSLDVVWLQKFEDIPQVFKRYVIYCASSRAAAQLVANPQLVQMLQQKEGYARAACLEYECNQTDPSFFGLGHDQRYTSFIPLDALRR